MLKIIVDPISQSFSGQAAKEDVAAIIRHHRIQASPGYRAAAEYVLDELRRAGLEAEIERYPADYENSFWTATSFQEWEAAGASLCLVEPQDQARKLADYRELKISLIQRSITFSGEAEVVLLEDGQKAADYAGLDVAGKLVLTAGSVERVRQLAVEQHGALGILFDGMSSAPPVREAADLPDARQYTSFWWTGQPDEKQCFGFVLSPRQGNWLRRLIQRRAAAGEPPVKLRAEVDTRFYDGQIEVVSAKITGQSEETVLLVSHLCHPQPSANDNASGAAANLEAARTLQQLIDQGRLPQPKRTIRFLWMPEMTGSYAYLSRHEADIPHMIAGLNLDMVGEDQAQTGSVLLLERPPEAAASFAPDLVERLREMVYADAKTYTGFGRYSLHRTATTGFSGGSDHYIFSDPTVGAPMPMLIQWPDKFYHTTADTLDKVSPDSLARAGTVAAAYAYFLASAGQAEVTWLAHEMQAHFITRLARLVQDTASGMGPGEDESLDGLQMRAAFWLDRHRAGLDSLARLWDGVIGLAEDLHDGARRFVDQELERAAGIVTAEPSQRADDPDEWEHKAAGLIPRRLYRGPASGIGGLAKLPAEERDIWYKLLAARPGGAYTVSVLAEYWADGRRTAAEIADLVEMETGMRDVELIIERFELLKKLGLIAYS